DTELVGRRVAVAVELEPVERGPGRADDAVEADARRADVRPLLVDAIAIGVEQAPAPVPLAAFVIEDRRHLVDFGREEQVSALADRRAERDAGFVVLAVAALGDA